MCIVYVTRQHSSIGSHVCTRPTLLGPTIDPIRISSRVCVCVCVCGRSAGEEAESSESLSDSEEESEEVNFCE